MKNSVIFSRVMEEYGTKEEEKEKKAEDTNEAVKVADNAKDTVGKKGGLMQAEERLTGSVSASVYSRYLRFAGGLLHLPIILALLVGYQGASGQDSKK